MKKIKSFLLKVLGQHNYLRLTSQVFFRAFKSGMLKENPAYYTHYLAQQLVNEGDTIIDIGANLGYYSRMFGEKAGDAGKVFAVEPIKLYRNILLRNTRHLPRVEVLPFALGESAGTLQMGIPSQDKHRHGLMRVLSPAEKSNADTVYEVEVKNPAELFSHLETLQYIKCDIEGYEVPVIPAMKPIIEKWRPVVQVETEGENKQTLFALFKALDYSMWYAGAEKLQPYTQSDKPLPGDMIAIPNEKKEQFSRWMQ